MTAVVTPKAGEVRVGRTLRLPLVVRLAGRELRAGLKGFYVFIACMALGVGVITAVGALADSLRAGFAAQGVSILGGDATLARMHARATAAERGYLESQGRVSEAATMRSMARRIDGSEQALIELKAVDAAYPLAGALEMRDGASIGALLARANSAVVDPLFLERMQLKVGDGFKLGRIEVVISGVVEREPDGLGDRLSYGARVFVSTATLMNTGLVQPGSLVRWRYALRLPEADDAALSAFRARAAKALPEAGFLYADRRDPSPRIRRVLDRLQQFLTLIGLTSLLIGGVGVANAVGTFIDRRRKVIGTMKSVGASGRMVFAIFFTQVMLIAGLGIAIGLAVGLSVPLLLDALIGSALPIKAVLQISPATVLTAIVYGVLVAALFTLWPLGRADRIRAGTLFREDVAPVRVRPGWPVIGATAAVLAALVGFAVLGAEARLVAGGFLAAVLGVLAMFAGLGWLVMWAARRAPRPRSAEWRLAIGNIGAPDGLTRSIVLSLGTGLSLLVAVGLTEASLTEELRARVPQTSPSYFALDIARSDRATFTDNIRKAAPGARIDEAPMLRGRIVSLNGRSTEGLKVPANAQWVLRGDRGLTYAETVPDGSTVTKGAWWAADYTGEPLVSLEQEIAGLLKLKVGDTMTVNVLGRNITARIANLREVKWESLAINFFMVFSPNALQGAPHNLLATVTLPKDLTPAVELAQEAAVARGVARALPTVTLIRVKDAIAAFEAVFAKVMTAVSVAGGVTLAAGALVLAGALATAQRRRIKQAVILKTLGATRRQILTSHLIEYLLLAMAASVFAVALGGLAAWATITYVMEIGFVLSVAAIAQALAVALGLILAFGVAGTWAVLRAPAVPTLRSE